jgi:hypothetical protein
MRIRLVLLIGLSLDEDSVFYVFCVFWRLRLTLNLSSLGFLSTL